MFSEIKKILSLLLSVAFSSIGFIAAITVAALSVREVSANPYLVGFPNALGVGGAFVGTQIFDYFSKKYSRLSALGNTFFIGGFGGAILILSLITDSFLLLLLGSFTLGVGQSATLQSRYAASFVASEPYKATSLSLAVWFSVFGSIFGPRLVGEYSELFQKTFNSELIVGYFIATAGMVLAGFSIYFLSEKNTTLREPSNTEQTKELISLDSNSKLLTRILVLNHFVMVVIMSATPLHIQDIGETIKLVGTIISYHTLGMFLFSPILGNLVDKYGAKLFASIGSFILCLSCILSLFNTNILFLKIGLYLLGLGWNFTFIAISAAISKYSIENSINLNIKSDSMVFAGSSVAHLSLGFTYIFLGYTGLVISALFLSLYLIFNVRKFSKLNLI